MTYRNVYRFAATALLTAAGILLLLEADTYVATSFALAASICILASLTEARVEEAEAEAERRYERKRVLRARATPNRGQRPAPPQKESHHDLRS